MAHALRPRRAHPAHRASAALGLLALLYTGAPRAGAQAVRLTARAGATTVDLGASTAPSRATIARVALIREIRWQPMRAGLSLGEIELRAGVYGTAVQAIVVRVDPSRFSFALQQRTATNGMTGTWSLDSVAPSAALAMNAGQFKETGPWGWLVLDGYEHRNPLAAPLAVGLRIDTSGRLRWVRPGGEPAARHDPTTAFAFQSFPLLMYDGRVPAIVRDRDLMDVGHRDARLILAERADGILLFILTRYAALGTLGERVPIGLTTPESIVLAAALGARHAVMLDGGVSAQLLVRDSTGAERRWAGLRRVPLALVATPRPVH